MEELKKLKANKILAALIDGLIMFILFWAIFLFPMIAFIDNFKTGTLTVNSYLLFFGAYAVGMLLTAIYLFMMTLIFKNATFGMKVAGIAFIQNDGNIPAKSRLFSRSFIFVLSEIFTLGLVLITDLLTIILSETGRDFHDAYSGLKVENVYDF
ncbi:MAG: RDD family protein [Bacilli bacterium]|nr:RDD family protein [Bacilli bacterium]